MNVHNLSVFKKACWTSSLLGLIPLLYNLLHHKYSLVPMWQEIYLSYYCALILCFVPGLYWGYELRSGNIKAVYYASSFSIIAWLALVFNVNFLVYALLFIIVGILDFIWLSGSIELRWFKVLRLTMTCLVVSLLITNYILNVNSNN